MYTLWGGFTSFLAAESQKEQTTCRVARAVRNSKHVT